MGRRLVLLMVCAVIGASAASTAAAGPARKPVVRPVPSLTPAATERLWRKLARQPRFRTLAATGECRPVRAVFYAGTDWLRLATKLAAAPSPCAQYYVSVPPLVADKTQPRADQAWRIRALGPSFHALAEINVSGWSSWVSTTGSSWHAAGVEARRRMAAAGYDVAAGDSWALNELSSAVRQGIGSARPNMRAFLRGLYEGDGTEPATRGAVFVTGMGQGTTELSVYQARLQDWYEDALFWNDMSAYVSDWSQELYGDVRNYAVAGADLATRGGSLTDYLQHEVALARAAPAAAAPAVAFLGQAHNPLANAAWQYDAAFGWTNVPYALMQDYVSAQTYALRSFGDDRFGFAWAPKNFSALPTADFTAQTDALLDRLAAAIADSAYAPEAACGNAWCGGTLDGAAFNHGWRTFASWKLSQLSFTTEPQALATNTASAPMTVELRTSTGLAYTTGLPLAVTLASSSAGAAFAAAAAGPWSSTLTVPIASASSTTTFYYRDAQGGSPVLTAQAAGKTAATQTETVTAPVVDSTPPETSIVAAPSGTVASTSASVAFSADDSGARFECSLDGVTFAPCSSPAALAALGQGQHAFDVRAVDAAGNADPTPARASWVVDTVAPDTAITSGPASRTKSSSATFAFSATEAAASFECSLDGGTYAPCTSPRTISGLSRATHVFRVRALDAAGNVDGTPAAWSWRVQ